MAEQHRRKSQNGLLIVQGVIAGVVLLVALVLRLIGGRLYEELRIRFRDALTDNGLAERMVWSERGDADAGI